MVGFLILGDNAISFVYWFAFWFFSMSFVEHYAHRRLMHKKSFLNKYFPGIYERHAVFHHRVYYKIFNQEDDEVGRDINIKFELLPSLPIALTIALITLPLSLHCSLMVMAAIAAHHLIWNIIHEEMHKPKNRFFSRWYLFRYLQRYHWLHHRYPGKNFNVVIPFADFVYGTNIKPSDKDLIAMRKIGI